MADHDDHIGDGNVERLLERAYRPEAPDPEFARRVEELMVEAARGARPSGRLRPLRRFGALAAAAVLTVAVVGLGSSSRAPRGRAPVAAPAVAVADGSRLADELMTARPREPAPAVDEAAVGETIRTSEGERRRVELPDGSVLMINSRTTVRLSGERRIAVDEGEVYVDVFPDPLSRFRVDTPHREVSALGTRFGVKVGDAGLAAVVVTHGKVAVSGIGRTLGAGQRFVESEGREGTVGASPRASHLLDWTRDLVAAAESPLVPRSEYGGGALVAIDPWGTEARLTMRRYHVHVHIEDGFARTTIDQTYFNHANWRLEGTFYFPLPADASLSRLAMYVNGRLMEGGMAERSRARNVYEQIVTRRKDPALLEWIDGTTFKMRVFPLEPREEKRILLSYTQRLPSLYGEATYRFPAGHSLGAVKDWSFGATVIGSQTVTSDSHDLAAMSSEAGVTAYSASARGHTFERDVVLRLRTPVRESTEGSARFSEARHEGHRYLMVRYRPELPVEPARKRRDWAFVFESAGNRDPLLARVQIDFVRTMLAHAEADDRFTVLTAGTRVRPYSDGLLPVTDENVRGAVAFLESAHLVGALDLTRAFAEAGDLLAGAENPYVVHVGSGVATIGERDPARLARQVPDGATYVGVAVGKQWSRPFMKEAAARSGGLFTQVNPDETIAWRAFDLMATLATPRLLDVSAVDDAESARFLVAADSVAHGEEILAVARLPEDAPLPTHVTLAGRLAGKAWQESVAVADVADGAGYLPRTWARLEIDRLVAALPDHEDAEKGGKEIVDLSMASYVMSPYTSLLVLEDDAMYERFGVDRGRKDHWAMYPAPEEIEVVREPVTGVATPEDPTARQPAEQVLRSILYRMPLRLVYSPYEGGGGGYAANVADLLRGVHGVQYRWLLEDLDDVTNGLSTGEWWDEEFQGAASAIRTIAGGTTGVFFNDAADGDFRARTENVFSYVLDFDTEIAPRWERWTEIRSVQRAAGRRLNLLLPQSGMRDFSGPIFTLDGLLDAPFQRSDERLVIDFARRAGFEGGGGGFFGFPGGGPAAGKSLDQYGLFDSLQTIAEDGARSGRFHFGLDAGRGYLQRLAYGQTYQWLTYQRRYVQNQPRYYRDVLSFAPGMNTSSADVRAVLDAEAEGYTARRGRVDDGARRLVERARGSGWQRVQVPGDRRHPAFSVSFDGTGRFAWERTLSTGLRERVVCDGTTLLHLYPDLGVGARRTFSRHHRALIARFAPWLLPPADDLARGADVVLLDDHTVEIRPLRRDEDGGDAASEGARLRLRFDDAGRLLERRLVRGPRAETLARVTFEGGTCVVTGVDGEEVARVERRLEDAAAPDLSPACDDLIVLALPFRSRGQVHARLQLGAKILNDPVRWTDAAAAHLLGANLCESYDQMARAVAERHIARGDRVLGAYVLLTSSQMDWDPDRDDTAFGGSKIARRYDPAVDLAGTAAGAFLGGALRKARDAERDIDLGDAAGDAPGDVFFTQLAATARHVTRFVDGQVNQCDAKTQARWRRELATFAATVTQPEWAWGVLAAAQQMGGGDRELHARVAQALLRFEGPGEMDYSVRYERATALAQSGHWEEARKLFLDAHGTMLSSGALPPIDGHFVRAVTRGGDGAWDAFARTTVDGLVARGERPAAIYFALQCRWVAGQPLADELFNTLLSGAGPEERVATDLAAVEYLWHSGGEARALDLVEALLAEDEFAEDKFAESPGLLELATVLADRQGRSARGLRYAERLMDVRYRDLPPVLNLQAVRQDHMRLLARYRQVASAVQALEGDVPDAFVSRVVRAADRWRALDTDPGPACTQAAQILRLLGEEELAWDYTTTPLGAKPNESPAWAALAQQLVQEGDPDLADRAYEIAFEIEPTNAQLLWDRATMLQQAGRRDRARAVFRRLADGEWQPRFQGLATQAARYLGR